MGVGLFEGDAFEGSSDGHRFGHGVFDLHCEFHLYFAYFSDDYFAVDLFVPLDIVVEYDFFGYGFLLMILECGCEYFLNELLDFVELLL